MLWFKKLAAEPFTQEKIKEWNERKARERASLETLKKKREREENRYKVPPAPPPPGGVSAVPQARPAPAPVAPAVPSAAVAPAPQTPMRAAPVATPQAKPSPMLPKQWGLPARGQEPGKVFEAPAGMQPATTPTAPATVPGRPGLAEGRPPEMQKWLDEKKRQQKKPI